MPLNTRNMFSINHQFTLNTLSLSLQAVNGQFIHQLPNVKNDVMNIVQMLSREFVK